MILASDFQQMHKCMVLIKKLESSSFWFSDFAKILPPHVNLKLAKIDAEIAVTSGAYDTETLYLDKVYGISTGDLLPEESLTDLLSEVTFCNFWEGGFNESAQLIINEIDKHIDKPDKCAKLMSSGSFKSTYYENVLKETNEIVNLFRNSKSKNTRNLSSDLQELELITSFISRTDDSFFWENLSNTKQSFQKIYNKTQIEKKYPLYPTSYSLITSTNAQKIISDPIEQIIYECSKKPQLLYKISPRDFEKVLKEIFESFGFHVDLTAQTRDGGADLICMSYSHGIPFKLAVEAKRYNANNPISVNLVRNFIGANHQINANKLVYVTTSRYTRDAIQFASAPGITDLIELKEFADIAEWTKSFESRKKC